MCYVKKKIEKKKKTGERLYILCHYIMYNESFVKHYELEKENV